jgi:C4-dicarboxylate transporter DctQ subunit
MNDLANQAIEQAEATRPQVRVSRSFTETLFRAIELVLALALIGAVLLNFSNVIGRYLLDRSLLGAEEVQTYLLVAVTFVGAAVVAWRGRELRMDVLANLLPPGARRAATVAEMLVMAACCGFTGWQSAAYAFQMAALGVRSEGADIPMWLPHGVVAVGLCMVAVIAVRRAVQALRGRPSAATGRVLH